jgi:hypothetical protein
MSCVGRRWEVRCPRLRAYEIDAGPAVERRHFARMRIDSDHDHRPAQPIMAVNLDATVQSD